MKRIESRLLQRVGGRGMLPLCMALCALTLARIDVALAAPAGSGALYVECLDTNTCCAEFDFAATSYDVFGTPVDMGSSVGLMRTTALAVTGFNGLAGTFSAHPQSTAAGVLDFDLAGSFLCTVNGCISGGTGTFVGDMTNLGGTFSLPAGMTYTLDGSDTPGGPLPAPTIPGCPSGPVQIFTGIFGVNAFQNAATPTGSNVVVPTSTTFFDSGTGTQVTVTIDATFTQVNSTGDTVVKAYSNASGAVPGNFAAQVNGTCAVDAGISCCTDGECPSGTCNGCYRPVYADVTTTAGITGPIEICSTYPDTNNDGIVDGTSVDETRLRFLHEEAGVFTDRTSFFSATSNRICAQVSSLSFFVVAVQETPAGVCPPAPATGCRTATKSLFQLKNDTIDDGNDKLIWKWLKGAATTTNDFGTPTSTEDYRLCLYAGAASASVAIPAGADWQGLGQGGFKFKSLNGAPEGATKAVLKAGGLGAASVLVKGKGGNLPDTLTGMLSLPVTVQLINDNNSTCFESVFDTGDVIKNSGTQFKAKAQ